MQGDARGRCLGEAGLPCLTHWEPRIFSSYRRQRHLATRYSIRAPRIEGHRFMCDRLDLRRDGRRVPGPVPSRGLAVFFT
jgi:hypothetical protein